MFFLISVGVFACSPAAVIFAETVADADPAVARNLSRGERIYREGVLPSGQPIQSYIKGDISVPGTSFSCVSCHLRSGLGSFEGGVVTPPTTGRKLLHPLGSSYKKVAVDDKYFPSHLQRPAYTDQSLAAALRGGVNPSGQVMNPVMPRYMLQDTDMALLISYLKSLSSEFSPGVSETELRFATVITDDVKPAEYEAMLAPLEQYVRHKNNMIQLFKSQKRSERMAAVMLESSELMYKKLTLSRWYLKGPSDTWRSQLEEYYRNDPVFALLGGISHGEWKPIHEFSEAHQLPSLFPQTKFPVVSDSDWYTLYFSKGYFQEGEGAARFLNLRVDSGSSGKIVQLVRASREGEALAKGFTETWRELQHPAPLTVTLKEGETITKGFLQQLLAREQPSTVIVWDGPDAAAAVDLLAVGANRPDTIVVSSGFMGAGLWKIAEPSRALTYITWPYKLPQDEGRFKRNIDSYKSIITAGSLDDTSLKQAYITTQILTQALMDLRGDYYRDNFFDVISMMKDLDVPQYERLSFGPGQRYASKGCFIVQLGPGEQPSLIKKSDWVIH
jgi:hypothetical protein